MDCRDLLENANAKAASGFFFVFLAFWYRIRWFLLKKKLV